MWKANPILGVGSGNFRWVIEDYQTPEQFAKFGRGLGGSIIAHSLPVECMAELGSAGAIALLVLIVATWRGLGRVIRQIPGPGKAPPDLDPDLAQLRCYADALRGAILAIFVAGAFLSLLYYSHLWVLLAVGSAVPFVHRRILGWQAGEPRVVPAGRAAATSRAAASPGSPPFRPRPCRVHVHESPDGGGFAMEPLVLAALSGRSRSPRWRCGWWHRSRPGSRTRIGTDLRCITQASPGTCRSTATTSRSTRPACETASTPWRSRPGCFAFCCWGTPSRRPSRCRSRRPCLRWSSIALRSEPAKRIEVINAGVSGWGTDDELRYLTEYGLKYQPDLVVVAMTLHNDISDNLRQDWHRVPERRAGRPASSADVLP